MPSNKPRKSGEAPSGQTGGFKKIAHTSQQGCGKSNVPRRKIKHALNNEAQIALTLTMLRLANRGNYELRAAGISHPAGRVRELRGRGCIIETHLVTAVDSDSFAHERVALYALIEEPAVMEVPQ